MVTFTEVVMTWKQKGKKVEWYSELLRAFRVHISPFSKHLGFPWSDCEFAFVNLQRFTLFTSKVPKRKEFNHTVRLDCDRSWSFCIC